MILVLRPRLLHGPPILVDKTNFGLVIYNHANFYRFEESFSYWSVKRISVFSLLFIDQSAHLRHHNVNFTVTNIENTVRAVHSCNSWFLKRFSILRDCLQ